MRWCVVVSLVLCGCTGSRVGAGDEPDAGALPDAARDASPWPDGCVELGVRDPGFQYEDVWEATGGAKVDVGADGCSSTGAGIFPSEAWCGAGAFSQTVAPCQDWTGRLIKVSLNLVCDEVFPGLCLNPAARPLALSINGASHVLEPMDLPSTENPWVTYSF
jgi:hypothetical protein